MEQRFPMENGQLTCRESGGRVEAVMEVRPPDKGLYHGYLVGPGGTCDLGTLMPEGGSLRLRRTLSAAQLRQKGCWPIQGGQIRKTYSFEQTPFQGWKEAGDLASLFPADPLLARAAGQRNRGLLRRYQEGGFSLAFPWDPRSPFPLIPVFCFAQVKSLGGKAHIVFRFRENGAPERPDG